MSGVYRKILVALDGSPESERALEQAIDLAHDQNARLTLLTVVPPLASFVAFSPAGCETLACLRSSHAQLLRETLARVPQDLGVTTLMLEGNPARQIVETVRNGDYDLVVMGSHGRGRLRGALLGSVSQQVVHRSPAPVLLCHPQRGDAKSTAPAAPSPAATASDATAAAAT